MLDNLDIFISELNYISDLMNGRDELTKDISEDVKYLLEEE